MPGLLRYGNIEKPIQYGKSRQQGENIPPAADSLHAYFPQQLPPPFLVSGTPSFLRIMPSGQNLLKPN